jgi:hypothetical protein
MVELIFSVGNQSSVNSILTRASSAVETVNFGFKVVAV